MSYGLIGFNFLRAGDDLVQIIRRTRPRVSVFFEDALSMIPLIGDACEIPIGRMWLEGSADRIHPALAAWAGQPVWPTEDKNYAMGVRLADVLVSIAPWVQVWQGYNEWPTYGNASQHHLFAALELGFVSGLHQRGRKAVVLNPPVGNLDAEHLRVFDGVLAVADYLGAHTYGSRELQLMSVEPPYYSMRPRAWIADAQRRGVRWPPLIRTEAGCWWPWKGSHPDVIPIISHTIAADTLWLGGQMLNCTYEVGACLYCCGSNGDARWDGFDVSNEPAVIDAIERFNADHITLPYGDSSRPQPTIPEVPTMPDAKLSMYADWSMARLANGEDPRDTLAFVQHLKLLGAEWRFPHEYGLPFVVVVPHA